VGVDFEAWFGAARVRLARPGRAVTIRGVGRTVSLLALGGPALGVTTRGLRWPLTDEDLGVGVARGVSNEIVGDDAAVEVAAGVLAVVEPG
jgi:thiamine pyrophosphokinase